MPPYCRYFGTIVASGLLRPSRFSSPKFRRLGFSQTSGASSVEMSLMPVPEYRLLLSVPESQYDAPLDVTPSAPTTVLSRLAVSPLAAIFRDAQKFALPAPPPIRPP